MRRARREVAPFFSTNPSEVRNQTRRGATLAGQFAGASRSERSALIAALCLEIEALSPLGPSASSMRCQAALERMHALPNGLRFLVELRAELLALRPRPAGHALLERELKALLATWFDIGLLQLRRMTWDSPASLLEKLIRYEAVHAIESWSDLRNRLDADRECYALFHPEMPDEPLIFVEVALTEALADRIGGLLDVGAPLVSATRARWAIFYSISNTQSGLRGISFGGALLKRVMLQLDVRHPRLRGFSTLSPIPGLRAWLEAKSHAQLVAILGAIPLQRAFVARGATSEISGATLARAIEAATLGTGDAPAARDPELLRMLAERLCARFLIERSEVGDMRDPVARFHLGNGACIERINWAADLSEKGIAESLGLMVNYRYIAADLAGNAARLATGKPRLSRAVGRLL